MQVSGSLDLSRSLRDKKKKWNHYFKITKWFPDCIKSSKPFFFFKKKKKASAISQNKSTGKPKPNTSETKERRKDKSLSSSEAKKQTDEEPKSKQMKSEIKKKRWQVEKRYSRMAEWQENVQTCTSIKRAKQEEKYGNTQMWHVCRTEFVISTVKLPAQLRSDSYSKHTRSHMNAL